MKVITPEEMARIEAASYQEGSKPEAFMEKAGEAVVAAILKKLKGQPRLIILCGKGNNAGDGLVAARILLGKGLNVSVCLLYPKEEGSVLFKRQLEAYKGPLCSHVDFQKDDLVIDAIFGTGFKGALEGAVLETVLRLNKSEATTLAIDIPSGLNGLTGEVKSAAVKASLTVTLGFPKTGFFIGQGFEVLGELQIASFGLPQKQCDEAKASYELFVEGESFALPVHKRTWHKYSRGYVLAFAGSLGMMGAASLCCLAALRSGAGIVRLLCEKDKALLSSLPTEILTAFFNEGAEEELKRCSALLAGPGIGREEQTGKRLSDLLSNFQKPVVLDADALWWLSKGSLTPPAKSVLTPHQGEMARLLESSGCADAKSYAERFDVIVVLKGAPTFIFAKGCLPLILAGAPSIMATAGSGDVLTGIIASLISQGLTPYEAAKSAVILHSKTGEYADLAKGFGAIAGDFVECLPLALKALSGMHKL